ncbi:MAG: hypothetical protein CM15mV134_370 [uncultured marine virus]|nr:MAG: hypothetical protein CM15mV134_370 [uncultured marine virus]
MKDKDPKEFAGGGVQDCLQEMQEAKFSKKAITTADKISSSETALK